MGNPSSSLLSHPSVIRNSAFAYSLARSLSYSAEFGLLNSVGRILFSDKGPARHDRVTERAIFREAWSLLRQDSANIASGIYPLAVLAPESPLSHATRWPRILLDGVSMSQRRTRGRTAVFDSSRGETLEALPRYYRRNFHFQTDGYLGERSADLYEHQVEMLFKGTADPMRRLILEPLRSHFKSNDGKGLIFLEVAAGTGRTTRFVRLAFPKARIIAVDLSQTYLNAAREKLADLLAEPPGIETLQGDAAALPFRDQHFDAVFSVFLYHELPLEVRRQVLRESRRVLKRGGFFGLVDSIQKDDIPELNPALEAFPKQFHEPYYRNYSLNPMERLIREEGFKKVQTRAAFFSKVCSARTGP